MAYHKEFCMARNWCLTRTEAESLVDVLESTEEAQPMMRTLAAELRELFGMDHPRWRCNDCGHEANELAENGASEEAAYCPMCGSASVGRVGAP
jgi:rubrerythrin